MLETDQSAWMGISVYHDGAVLFGPLRDWFTSLGFQGQ